MGLDVYLRKCKDFEYSKAQEALLEAACDVLYEARKNGELTQLEYDAKRQEAAEQYGCTGSYGRHVDIVEIEENSIHYPEHMFKIGYFRSSYNGGGIDNILHTMGLPTLQDIFKPGDRYEFKPNWEAALSRIDDLITSYKQAPTNYRVMDVGGAFAMNAASNDAEALNVAMRIIKRGTYDETCKSFSCREGNFFLDGLTIVAAVEGEKYGKPCVYLVYKIDNAEGDWYLQALEIVKETIEYVLAQPDKDDYYLIWSG